jgi:hypothetical protein
MLVFEKKDERLEGNRLSNINNVDRSCDRKEALPLYKNYNSRKPYPPYKIAKNNRIHRHKDFKDKENWEKEVVLNKNTLNFNSQNV